MAKQLKKIKKKIAKLEKELVKGQLELTSLCEKRDRFIITKDETSEKDVLE
jgi:hypothetical protein